MLYLIAIAFSDGKLGLHFPRMPQAYRVIALIG
jgi:hypothetical protein